MRVGLLTVMLLIISLTQAQSGDVQTDSNLKLDMLTWAGYFAVFLITLVVIALSSYCFCCKRSKLKTQSERTKSEKDYTKKIKKKLRKHKGLAIIVGMTEDIGAKGVEGGNKDVDDMNDAFDNLGFGIVEEKNLSREDLCKLIEDAANFDYSDSDYKDFQVIAFYFTGHGGIDTKSEALQISAKDGSLKIYADIVSKFYPSAGKIKGGIKRMFFFDTCLGPEVDPGYRSTTRTIIPEFRHPAEGNCLVAFSVSPGYKARGNTGEGGYWTRHLSAHLTDDDDIAVILAEVYEKTVEDINKRKESMQGPLLVKCMGKINLRSDLTESNRIQFDGVQQEQRGRDPRRPLGGQAMDRTDPQQPEPTPPIIPPDGLHLLAPDTVLGQNDHAKILKAINNIGTDWDKLAPQLGLYPDTIKIITKENKEEISSCIMSMVNKWLNWADNVQAVGKPSWRILVEKVNEIKPQLASQIINSEPWKN